MSLIAVCSGKGSPGVTTAALALATSSVIRETALLIEADPAGGDLASRLGIPAEPGLASLAAAGRRQLQPDLINEHVQHAAGIDLLVAPAGASSTRAALNVLEGAFLQALNGLAERVVISDLGRIEADSTGWELAQAADLVLLVTRPLLADLAHVAEEENTWRRLGAPMALLLSGEPGPTRRERYPAAEVSDALGIEVFGTLAWDPKGVAALLGHRPEVRRSAFVQSARVLVDALVQRLPGSLPKVEPEPAVLPTLAGPAPAGAEL